MAVEQELRRWDTVFAGRTRAGGGEGLIAILALAAAEDVISLAGGLPDPATFPGPAVAEILGELVDRGDRVLVEAPTYLGAVMAFQSFEADVVGVPLDDQGLAVDELERILSSGPAPKLLYTIPDHQNPAGVSLSPERRTALVELARRHGLLVVEAGTFSKTFFPGVRLGWAAGPPDVVAKLVWAKQNTDQCAGALGQRLLEEYGRRGLLDEGVARARELYRRRRDVLLAALDRHLSGSASWTRPDGGFFTWVKLPPSVDAVTLAERALESGVAVVPGVPFYPDGGGEHHLRLSYSRVTEEEIEEGIRRLAGLLATGR